ncbi:MAG: glycosyltransferase [Actinobacteria bacterium]|nr:glycosyltransferase [Actinomycetota bacterium]
MLPLRVLFIDHETRLSGGEQDLLDLVRVLARDRTLEISVALPGDGPLWVALEAAGARVHPFTMDPGLGSTSRWELAARPDKALRRTLSVVQTARSLGRVIDEVGPHIIHTNSMKAHLLAAASARTRGIPLIWHVRDILRPGWLRRTFAFAAWRIPTKIACLSKAVTEQFSGSHALEKCVVVYNGIDLGRAEVSSEDRQTWRKRLGAPSDQQVLVGIVGQIAAWKGQDTFIEAAAIVAQDPNIKNIDVRFTVVGECLFPENEAAYEGSIHARVTELGLESRWVWAGWSDSPESVMAALDVVVHASKLPEPFGRVIVEGMAAGTSVIASAEGAGPEIVLEGEGSVVVPGDPIVLAAEIAVYVKDPYKRTAVSEAARKGAERFSIEATAQAVLDIYAEVSADASGLRVVQKAAVD